MITGTVSGSDRSIDIPKLLEEGRALHRAVTGTTHVRTVARQVIVRRPASRLLVLLGCLARSLCAGSLLFSCRVGAARRAELHDNLTLRSHRRAPRSGLEGHGRGDDGKQHRERVSCGIATY